MVTREDILFEARNWLEVPWRHQGRSHKGIDCVGLIVVVGRSLNLLNYDTTTYQRRSQGQEFVRHFYENGDPKPLKDMVIGDVLVFVDDAYPCHCGILSEKIIGGHRVSTVIHAYARRRKVVEEILSKEWSDKRRFCFSYRGVKN